MANGNTVTGDRGRFVDHSRAARRSLAGEFVDFLRYNRKWWLVPIVVCLALLSVIIVVGSSPAAPFIYTLF